MVGEPNKGTIDFSCDATILVWVKSIHISDGNIDDANQHNYCTNAIDVVFDAISINDVRNGLDVDYNQHCAHYFNCTSDHFK